MKKMITITGLKYCFGPYPFKKGQKVVLVKEPDNEHDKEAIRVELPGLGKVGYVANSSFSVTGECMSAGRLYDKIGDTARAKVKYILPNAIICKVLKDKNAGGDAESLPEDAAIFAPSGAENT